MIENYQPEPLLGKQSKRIIKWALIVTLALAFQAVFGQAPAAPSVVAPTPTPIPFTLSPQISDLAKQAGLSLHDVEQAHAQIGIAGCDARYFVACYDPSTQTVYLYPQLFTKTNENPASTLAYEMSHYYWQQLGEAGQASFKPELDAFYLAHKQSIDVTQADLIRIEGGFGTSAFYDELHSIACTETLDTELSPKLYNHCFMIAGNRGILDNFY